jgi:hypothetical protein
METTKGVSETENEREIERGRAKPMMLVGFSKSCKDGSTSLCRYKRVGFPRSLNGQSYSLLLSSTYIGHCQNQQRLNWLTKTRQQPLSCDLTIWRCWKKSCRSVLAYPRDRIQIASYTHQNYNKIITKPFPRTCSKQVRLKFAGRLFFFWATKVESRRRSNNILVRRQCKKPDQRPE